MKRTWMGYLAVLGVLLAGCNMRAETTESIPETKEMAVALGAPASLKADSTVTVRLHCLENYNSPEERAYAVQAAQKLQEVLNSPEFYAKLSKLTFRDNVQPVDISRDIKLAHEQTAPFKDSCADHVLDFWLRLDATGLNCNGSSIGGDGDTTGYVNSCPNRIRCWTANGCVAAMAGHLMHEYMHHLGYFHNGLHKFQKSPYVVGYLVRDMLTDPNGKYKLKYCAEWPNNIGPCQH